MKKTAMLIMLGAAFLFATNAYGSELASVVGKKVGSTMKLLIDGQQAPSDVIIVEGASYLPVRASADLFGYDVDYKDRVVYLNKKKEPVYDVPGTEYISGDQIDKELKRLEGLAAMYANVIDALYTGMTQYSEGHMKLIQEYYTKLSNVQMQMTYLKGYKDFRDQLYANGQ